jgi:menaquinone-specific isochorismate synthase
MLWRLEQDQLEFARQAVVHIGAIDAPAWIRSVDDLVAEIRRGLVDKVVLARPIEAWQEHDWKLSAVASALIEHQPSTYRFLMMDGDETFVGASPETLLAAAGNQIRTVCLAGSAPRSADPDLDARLGSALLHDAKNQKEHAIVVQYVGDVLRSMAEAVTLSPVHVKKWPDLQHLETTVEAQLRTDFSILRVAAALHPTPAVLGYPREQAWAAMRRYEHWDRGWYAGPVGWMNGVGEGEFAVAIRSALLAGTHAWLFSGAGIVGDSSGAREFEETEWKAQTMIQVLEGRRRE